MIILGIDPGIATTGYGVIEKTGHKLVAVAYGAILTPAGMDLPERLLMLSRELQTIMQTHQPESLGIEELFFNTNVKTAMTVGQARGVVLLVAEQNGIKSTGYTPPQVKSAVCGYGKADKIQVQDMVMRLLNLKAKPKPDDVADALAIAICHAHSSWVH